MKNKIISILIIAMLIVCMIPTSAFAELGYGGDWWLQMKAGIEALPSGGTYTYDFTDKFGNGNVRIRDTIVIDKPCTINIIGGARLLRYDDSPGRAFVITADNVTLNLGEVELYAFTPPEEYGGAIYITGNKCTVSGGKFRFCNCQYGGGICVAGNNCTINGGYHEYSQAGYGCAISLIGDNNTVNDVQCHGTTSVYGGGAIYVEGDYCKINRGDFRICETQGYGGALYLAGYKTEVYSDDQNRRGFYNCCHANKDGGAIYADDDASISFCKFVSNSAGNDGGSIKDQNWGGDVYIDNCIFETGSCGGDGIWVEGFGNATITSCTPGDEEHYYNPYSIDKSLLTGSIFSEGNMWIVGSVGGFVLGALVMLLLTKTKKKAC